MKIREKHESLGTFYASVYIIDDSAEMILVSSAFSINSLKLVRFTKMAKYAL